MKCTIECYDREGKLVVYVGAYDEDGANRFVEDHKDIYSRIKVSRGLKADCKKMLDDYYTGGRDVKKL